MSSTIERLIEQACAEARCVLCERKQNDPQCKCWVRLCCELCPAEFYTPREEVFGDLDEVECRCPEHREETGDKNVEQTLLSTEQKEDDGQSP